MASSFFSSIGQKLKNTWINNIWHPIKKLWNKTLWPSVERLGSKIYNFLKNCNCFKSTPYSHSTPSTEEYIDPNYVHRLIKREPTKSTVRSLSWELDVVTPQGQRIVGDCSVLYKDYGKNDARSKSALFGHILYQWYEHRKNIQLCLSTIVSQVATHGLFRIYHRVQNSSGYFYMGTIFLKPPFDCSIPVGPTVFFPRRNKNQSDEPVNRLTLLS